MDEAYSYVLVWSNEAGEIRTLYNYALPESDPDYGDPEYRSVRAYRRDQLRATDVIVTDAEQVKALVLRTTPQEPIAIPVSTARELGWFPAVEYRGFDMA